MAPKKTQKWGVKTRTLQLMQTVREFTWDPGGHDKQLKELKPEWFSFKQEICLWISRILTNLSNKISEEDDEPRKSKTHTWQMKRLIILKLDSDCSGIGFSNMQLKLFLAKAFPNTPNWGYSQQP